MGGGIMAAEVKDTWTLGIDVAIEDIDSTIEEIRVKDITLSGAVQTEELAIKVHSDNINKVHLDVLFGSHGFNSSIVDSQIVPYERIIQITDASPESTMETRFAASARSAKEIHDKLSDVESRVDSLESGSSGGSSDVVVDTQMSDTSVNAVQNRVIKKYVDQRAEQAYGQANEYTDEEVAHLEGVLNARIDKKQDALVDGQNIKTINGESILGEGDITIEVGEGSEGSLETYVFYFDEELTEEKIEANKRAYEAAMAETPALYVISSYGDIIVPTMMYISSSDGDSYVHFGISSNEEIANSEARNREYLDVFNVQIRFAEDGTFTIHKQFDSRLAKVSMLDEVIAKVDEIPDIVANLPQGEKFYYVHFPYEDAPLEEWQLAENAASCTKWLEANKNNGPLPILCWAEFPNGEGRMTAYDSSDSSLGFFIRITLGAGNDESLDNAEVVGMLIIDGMLSSTGEVELFTPIEEKILPTINSFKTINGQSILGEGDIEIQGGGSDVEVDSELSEVSENAVSNKAVTMALAETEEVAAAALNELNKRFENYALKEEIDATIAEVDNEINHIEGVLEATIIEDEEVTAAALVDLDKRVTNLEQNGGGGGGGDIYNVSFSIDPSTMELVMAYDVQPTFDFTLDENGNLIAII